MEENLNIKIMKNSIHIIITGGTMEKGIYVCMNSHVFSPEEITKNLSEGKFTSIYGH